MTDGDYLYCILNNLLDDEEYIKRLCPSCREEAESGRCLVCGAAFGDENPNFSAQQFMRLAKEGAN